ncbi:MAG: GatB/YqeY domain-containing protein [Ignavibacteriales bacterium]
MNLREKISSDLKNALRDRKAIALSVLRMLQSSIKNKEIEKKKGDAGLTDEEVVEVIISEIKKRKEAIEGYMKGQRQDLVDKENAELAVLMSYMPRQMGEAGIREEAKRAIDEAGAKIPQDMGKVMKILMPRMKGKADGALVNKIVKEELEKMLSS